ncbi:MAG: UDP-N-acetylglucosamine 2-epimerase (non-hydrolyzing) [Polyangia bacterium]
MSPVSPESHGPPPLIALVAGARPNFMKIAPISRELQRRAIPARLIHTGQHFDENMSDVFFRDLGMPAPDVRLGAGGGTQAQQTAAVLVGIEAELLRARPALVVVVGDVTSTVAAALAAAKLGVPVVHVEAGLRSRDWTMPEEINRVLCDRLSDLLLTPSPDARDNLLGEGIAAERIVFVGNVMIDSLHYAVARPTDVLARLQLGPRAYAVATIHRPSSVDTPAALRATLDALAAVAARVPLVLPVHPRTRARLDEFALAAHARSLTGLMLTEPLGYNDFVTLFSRACLALTDSGGIQEETTALGIPCLTMRDSTERPITVTEGTNLIVGTDRERIARALDEILAGKGKTGRVPEGWDGHAASRIVDALKRFCAGTPRPLAYRPGSP